MVEFEDQDLSGSRFRHVDLSRSTFRNIDLSGARLLDVDLVDVEITGWLENLRINEVDVAPLIEAELDRRYPDRVKMRPTDADGFREAWAILERLWVGTVDRARKLPPDLLHARVHDEWSFIETLRHLLFATDAWLLRAFLAGPRRTTRSTCHTRRWATCRACRATSTRDRRSTRCSQCAPTASRPSGRCSPTSPTSGWPAPRSRCWSPATRRARATP
jgi:hypothetical protein